MTDSQLRQDEALQAAAELVARPASQVFLLVELSLADLAWSPGLASRSQPGYAALETRLNLGLTAVLNSSAAGQAELLDTAPTEAGLQARLAIPVTAEFCSDLADRLERYLKPPYGKTRQAGEHRVATLSARPLLRRPARPDLVRVLATVTKPSHSAEFFRSASAMAGLAGEEVVRLAGWLATGLAGRPEVRQVRAGPDNLSSTFSLQLAEFYVLGPSLLLELYVELEAGAEARLEAALGRYRRDRGLTALSTSRPAIIPERVVNASSCSALDSQTVAAGRPELLLSQQVVQNKLGSHKSSQWN